MSSIKPIPNNDLKPIEAPKSYQFDSKLGKLIKLFSISPIYRFTYAL